jgi:hypothetical protein
MDFFQEKNSEGSFQLGDAGCWPKIFDYTACDLTQEVCKLCDGGTSGDNCANAAQASLGKFIQAFPGLNDQLKQYFNQKECCKNLHDKLRDCTGEKDGCCLWIWWRVLVAVLAVLMIANCWCCRRKKEQQAAILYVTQQESTVAGEYSREPLLAEETEEPQSRQKRPLAATKRKAAAAPTPVFTEDIQVDRRDQPDVSAKSGPSCLFKFLCPPCAIFSNEGCSPSFIAAGVCFASVYGIPLSWLFTFCCWQPEVYSKSAREYYRTQLVEIYRRSDPSKIARVDDVMEHYSALGPGGLEQMIKDAGEANLPTRLDDRAITQECDEAVIQQEPARSADLMDVAIAVPIDAPQVPIHVVLHLSIGSLFCSCVQNLSSDEVRATEGKQQASPAQSMPKFCPECGHKTQGFKFCTECGQAMAMAALQEGQLKDRHSHSPAAKQGSGGSVSAAVSPSPRGDVSYHTATTPERDLTRSPHNGEGSAGGATAAAAVQDDRRFFDTQQSAALRAADSSALVGKAIEVGGRTGVVRAVVAKVGSSTLHTVDFGGGRTEAIRLAKSAGGKGVKFHIAGAGAGANANGGGS